MFGMLASCAAATVVALASCGGGTPAEPVTQVGAAVIGVTAEGGNVYLIGERETVDFDVTGIDQLDLIMDAADPSEGGWVERCNHVGGEPVQLPDGASPYRCEGIDH